MAIAVTDPNAATHSTAGATTYDSASWTPEPNALALVWVVASSGQGSPSGLTGNGLTWTELFTDNHADGAGRTTLFAADTGAGGSTGVTTVTYGGTQTGCHVIPLTVTGVDLSGGVAAAIVQSPANSGTGTSGSVTLAAAGAAGNRPMAAFHHQANELSTPRTDWTEGTTDGNFNSPASGAHVQWRTDAFETTASATWTSSVAWDGTAVEIKAASGDQTVTPGLVDQTGTTLSPTVTPGEVTTTPGLIDQTAVVFAATVAPGQVTVTVGLIDQTGVTFAPTVQGALVVTPGLIDSTGATFTPTVTPEQLVTPGLVDSSGATFSPTVTPGSVTVIPGLITSTGTVFAFSLAAPQTVSPGLIRAVGDAFDDVFDDVFGGLSYGIFAPAIQPGQGVSPPLITQTGQVFAPTVTGGVVTVAPDLIVANDAYSDTYSDAYPGGGHVFEPVVGQEAVKQVLPALIDQTAQAFEPSVVPADWIVAPPLIDRTAVAFAPDVTNAGPVVPGPFALLGDSVRPEPWFRTGRGNRWDTTARPESWDATGRPTRWSKTDRPTHIRETERTPPWFATTFDREDSIVALTTVVYGPFTENEVPEALLVRVFKPLRAGGTSPMELFNQTPAWTATVSIEPVSGPVVSRSAEIMDPADLPTDYPDDFSTPEEGWVRVAWVPGDFPIEGDVRIQLTLDNGTLVLKSTDVWQANVNAGPASAVT